MTKKPKVASSPNEIYVTHLTSMHSPNHIRIFVKECQSLKKAGYSVSLIALHNKDETVEGIKIIGIALPRRRILRMVSNVFHLFPRALEERANVYHFHIPELIPVGLLLKAKGKKVVYDIHEDTPRSLLARHYLPSWLRLPISWLFEKLEDIYAHRFSALVAATPAIGERFLQINPNTVVVNNYPIRNELCLSNNIPWCQRPNSVAYVGAINEIRGGIQMVEAMSHLDDAFQPTLEIAGWLSEPLKEQLMALPGWSRVRYFGVANRTEIAQILGRTCAGLVLIHPKPAYIESQPTKLYEYMSAGIPVIASDFPLWRDLINKAGCGILVDPLNPVEIAKAIEFILTHPKEAEKMGQNGLEAINKSYNWRSEEEKLLKLYSKMITSN